jgi:hypothetical protein
VSLAGPPELGHVAALSPLGAARQVGFVTDRFDAYELI